MDIAGRGTGKSYIIGVDIDRIVRKIPRSISAITGQTYSQIMTRTLPSTLKCLEILGYEKGKDYVIDTMPPKDWATPYEKVTKYKNFISFLNGTGFLLLSQDRTSSARGPNIDREIVDEALTLDKAQYDQEVSPSNRGNEEYFGFRSAKPVKQHHGFQYVSSMPYSQDQRWLLDFGKCYEQEAGIMHFDGWNRNVMMQIELIKAYLAKDASLYKNIHNEIIRIKHQIVPFVSKDKILFTLSNAFDNIANLGISYIARENQKRQLLTFLIEIMKWVIDKVEDCYHHPDNSRYIYYDASNEAFIRSYAEENNFDYTKLSIIDSHFDLDCDSSKPLEICQDWGAKICLFSVGQERFYSFATKKNEHVDCIINDFFVKPEEVNDTMINELVDQFCDYYQHHTCKEIVYFVDRYGNNRQPNIKNSKPCNEQAID